MYVGDCSFESWGVRERRSGRRIMHLTGQTDCQPKCMRSGVRTDPVLFSSRVKVSPGRMGKCECSVLARVRGAYRMPVRRIVAGHRQFGSVDAFQKRSWCAHTVHGRNDERHDKRAV